MAIGWGIAAVVMAITIIGIPWRVPPSTSRSTRCCRLATKRSRAKSHFGRGDTGTGPLGAIGNIIWLVLAGWWLALGHLVVAIVLAVTIIGIPFAWAHLKLAGIALWPIGKIIVLLPMRPYATPARRTSRAPVMCGDTPTPRAWLRGPAVARQPVGVAVAALVSDPLER